MDRTDLPEGTVTLMFTDIEGSTTALRRLGDRYGSSLELHRAVVRAAVLRHGGVEVDTQGDAFLLAFARAGDAVGTADEITRALDTLAWPQDVALRARIGIHTGQVERVSHGYVGLELHRASRICAAAHGGQVVVSASTRALADGHAFLDLGHHHLKDFDEADRLFQLAAPDGRTFPPLRTRARRSLPRVVGRFVGRAEERAELEGLLSSEVRLVTLTGPGGAGKSRLALEVAHGAVDRYAHGVHLARLASVDDPADIPRELAGAIGIPPGGDPADAVVAYLADRDALVILDNLEQLQTGAIPFLRRLLDEAPRTTLLVTSRSPVGLRDEQVLDLGPLDDRDAAELFADRAQRADGRFALDSDNEPLVHELCRRIDGLPLAIEIVAARIRTVSVGDLADGVAFDLRTQGPVDMPEHQRTLEATIAWGTSLLDDRLRTLHAQLGVFQGRFTAEAAQFSFDASFDDLDALVRAALLRRIDDRSEVTRLAMLQTVRDFAREQLRANGTMEHARTRRAAWVETLATTASAALAADDPAHWLTELEQWLPDIRATLRDASNSGGHEQTIRIVSALERFWRARGDVAEPRSTLARALEAMPPTDDEARARAAWTLARLALAQGDASGARAPLLAALDAYRRAGAERETAFALTELAWIELELGDLEAARIAADEARAVAERAGDDRAASSALTARATVASERGEASLARQLAEESLAIRRGLGDRQLIANSALTLGTAALADGDLVRAEEALAECLSLATVIGDVLHEAGAHCCLGEIASLRGDRERARSELLPALETFLRLGNEPAAAECLVALASVEQDPARALRFVDAAATARAAAGAAPLPVERELEAGVRGQCAAVVLPPSGGALSLVDAALLAGADPTRI